MAIKIPSKNIYEIDNPKIRDNMIDNVSVEQTVITPNNDYETPIHNAEIDIFDNDLVNGQEQSPSISAYSSNYEIYDYPISFALAYFSQPKYISIDLQIPILQNNKYISKIIDGVDDNNNSNINISIGDTIIQGNADNSIIGKLNEYKKCIINEVFSKIKDLGQSFTVICGSGNNGGDGLAIGR